MIRKTIRVGLSAAAAVGLAACGSAGTFANKPRPATPVNLTVYINDQRISVSPAKVGAGPVQFIVTNEASRNESIDVLGGTKSIASTSPINPGATTDVTVDFPSGVYTIATTESVTSGALPGTKPIASARLHIGSPRPAANNALLQP